MRTKIEIERHYDILQSTKKDLFMQLKDIKESQRLSNLIDPTSLELEKTIESRIKEIDGKLVLLDWILDRKVISANGIIRQFQTGSDIDSVTKF